MTENAPVTVNGTVDGEKALKEIRKIYETTGEYYSDLKEWVTFYDETTGEYYSELVYPEAN